MRLLVPLTLLVAVFAAQGVTGQDAQPLPDAQAFFEHVRANMARSQRQQHRYAYHERRSDVHTNPFGKLGTDGESVYEVVPLPDGTAAQRRLIERDGKPVAGTTSERMRLPAVREGGSRSLDDIVRNLAFSIAGRGTFNGHPAIVVSFEPRPNVGATTRQGRIARAFKGTIWVDEMAGEVEHVEATAIDDISFGFGLVARVGRGATVRADRRPVDGGIWLPTAVRFQGDGRAMLFRKLDVDFAVDWFDYRVVQPAP